MLLTALLLGSAALADTTETAPAPAADPTANMFSDVPGPAPAPGPELEWVFNQPSPDARVRTVFDLERMDVEGDFRSFRAANAGLIGGVEVRKMSPAAALDALRGLLNTPQTQEALATIRSRPRLQTAAALENFTDAAFATGHPLFALCGLWLIEERWPGNPDVRFNLASLLAQHGSVNEAQALLDDLVARQKLPEHPFGITAQQGGDYLRAYILTRQGRAAEAAQLLEPIVAENPSFGEAALLFALVAEPEEEARKAYTMGIWRRKPPARPPATVVPGDTGTKADTQGTEDNKHPPEWDRPRHTGLDPALLVDLSKGKPGELPAIPQPVSQVDRIEFGKWVGGAMQAVTEESRVLLETRDAHMERCRAKNLPEPVRERLMALERIIEPENSRLPELRALLDAENKAIADQTDAMERVVVGLAQRTLEIARMDLDTNQECALLTQLDDAAAATMRVHVQAVDLATRRLHRRWHQYATALGTLTADSDFRAYLEAHIKASSQLTYAQLLGNMALSCGGSVKGACMPKKPGQKNELGNTEGGGLANCSEEDAKDSVGVEVKDFGSQAKPINVSVGIEVTCDGFSLEIGAELFKSVGLSAEAEFKTDGTCTLYLGPKATLGVGGQFGGKESSIKTGFYLTMNKDSFTDAGMKEVYKTTTKIEALGVSGTVSHAEGDPDAQKHSFFPGPDSGRNASG